MKQIFFVFFSFFIFFNSIATEKYWSNEKVFPTDIEDAETFIFKHYEKITPKDEKFSYPKLQGIWYGQSLGFVGIYEEKYKSNKFKMFLIKAPKGFGLSQYPEFANMFDTHKDHEGTLEATIVGFETLNTNEIISINDYIVNGKVWYLQDDGSYRYENSEGTIELLSQEHFKWSNPTRDIEEQIFVKVDPWLKKKLNYLDSSKKITDFEMETDGGGLFIYYDTKVKDNIVTDKFFNLAYSGTVSVGDIAREIGGKYNSIEALICHAKNSGTGLPLHMYYINNITSEKNSSISKLVKKNCEVNNLTYSTFKNYKYRSYYWTAGIFVSLIVIFFFLKIQRSQELTQHNKKNKNKFKTYAELKEYKQKIEEKESLRKAKIEEKERKAEEAKLEKEAKAEEARIKAEERRLEREEKRKQRMEFKEAEDDYDNSLMDKVKRLKRLYKNGTLSKAEFEKAKNKLLK